eukprot:TRINITY_DN4085_c0_g1_i5.p2 TRINITY_DN4085_c0_g1~~TRINITY_DN4085_c0_g1_i5.p2  ORF type:complete len:138 (-),score=12.97 TRINITY_DN4085_c0_g1_i5:29-442(-)
MSTIIAQISMPKNSHIQKQKVYQQFTWTTNKFTSRLKRSQYFERQKTFCHSNVYTGGSEHQSEVTNEMVEKLRVGVVIAQFNELVTDKLAEGVRKGLNANGVLLANVDEVYVPGSFEIPLMAKTMAFFFSPTDWMVR